MTGEPENAPADLFARVLVVLAGLLFGVAALTWFAAVTIVSSGWLVAVLVLLVGLAVFFAARRPSPFGTPVVRGIGSGLIVLGVYLFASALMVWVAVGSNAERVLLVLVLYVPPALAALLLAATGMRVWTGAAGILVVAVAATVAGMIVGNQLTMAIPMLVVAVLLTVAAVVAPAGASWGDLVGAAAATATTYAAGIGFSLVGALVLQQVPGWNAAELVLPATFVQVVCTFGAVLLATVLILVATARRDPATGLVAASVVVLPTSVVLLSFDTWRPYVWVPLVVLVVALVGLRVPAVRAALAAVPSALRERRPSGATTAAACAVVAGAALVVFAVRGLAELDASWRLTGVLAAALLLVAGALAYFLPGVAGAALAVVALVGLFLARPWANLLLDGPTEPGTGVLGMVELATALAAAWALGSRHARPAVLAAAAYLLLGTLPDVLAPLLGLSGDRSPDPTGHAAVLVLPLVLVGLPAAVLSWGRPAARWQAVGAVVLGATVLLPLRLNIAVATQGAGLEPAPLVGPFDALLPTDLLNSASHLDGDATATVVVVVLALAAVSVLSVVRRPATPLAVAAALSVFELWPMAVGRFKDEGGHPDVLAPVLAVLAVLLAVGAILLARHRSRDRLVHEA